MLDFSFGEIAIVVLVALLVVGPKDLPVVMRAMGKWLGQFKGLTDEFRTGFKTALHDLSLGNVEQDMQSIREETKFIRDEQGNLQRVYDLNDFIDSKPAAKEPATTLQLDDKGIKS